MLDELNHVSYMEKDRKTQTVEINECNCYEKAFHGKNESERLDFKFF